MDTEKLTKLLKFYQNALSNENVEEIERAVQLLQHHLPEVDRNISENVVLLQQLEAVHNKAKSLIQSQMDELKVKMDESHSNSANKSRDLAYAQTQLSQKV